MSQDFNQNAPQPAVPSTAPRPVVSEPANSNGLKSTLKIVIPLVVLVLIVFGITYVMMYVPPAPEKDAKNIEGDPSGIPDSEPPLRFFDSTRMWNPPALVGSYRNNLLLAPSAIRRPDEDPDQVFKYSLQDRLFQGVFETSSDIKRNTQFWFENRNDKPVTLEVKQLGCSACTSGRVINLPPDVTRDLLQYTAVAALPTGSFNGFKLGMIQPAASISQVKGEEKSFENYHKEPVKFKVPAAANADKWSPQWGILELQFKTLKDWSKEPLTADFMAQVDGSKDFASPRFEIFFAVAPACAVFPPNLELGTIGGGATDRPIDFLVASATRGPGSEFGDLEKPSCRVEPTADPTPYLEIVDKDTLRIPDAELPGLQNMLQQRVRSAYKFTVIVHPKVGDKQMDIGKFERIISITAGGITHSMRVTAMVRGSVWLAGDRTDIELGTFSGRTGLKKQPFNVITEKPGMELVIVKEESKQPAKFTYELEKQPDSNGQGHYKLFITIPEGKVYGKVQGEVILEVKGPTPQRMKIPVSGSGSFSGG